MSGSFADTLVVGVLLSTAFGDLRPQFVENRVPATDRLQIAILEVCQIGQERSDFQFPIGKLSLKVGKAYLLAFEFLILG